MNRPILSVSAQYPHCDQRILHIPEECEFCADATELQAERERLGVSNSGHANRAWPCPADYERGAGSYNQWGGNRPTTRAQIEDAGNQLRECLKKLGI